jgi:predicted O-linked N-acetylglucosamine transferase (SPINDLY family)
VAALVRHGCGLTMPTVAEVLQIGVDLHQRGRFDDAARIYGQVLAFDPDQPDALHLLGMLASGQGAYQRAVHLIGRAVAAAPDNAAYMVSWADARHHAGRPLPEATSGYRRAVGLGASGPEVLAILGSLQAGIGDIGRAVETLRRAAVEDPGFAAALINLGAVERRRTMFGAIRLYRRARVLAPDDPVALVNLSDAQREAADATAAMASARAVLLMQPASIDAEAQLGLACQAAGIAGAAAAAYRRALRMDPQHAVAHGNLAIALYEGGAIIAAIAHHRASLMMQPAPSASLNNVGIAWMALGELDQAIASFRRHLACEPEDAAVHSNMLFALSYHPAIDEERWFTATRAWALRHAARLYPRAPRFANTRDPERRLRVGYLSADFCSHAIAYNMIGLLEQHDHRAVEVACYASVARPDEMTERYRRAADLWRPIAGLDDPGVAALIQRDQIDILLVMAGHTAGNRPRIYAYKPAPILASYGDLGTTGIETVDYWLTDPRIHPADTRERFVEELVRLPVAVIHEPPAGAPAVGPLPAGPAGFVTFGSCNNLSKVTPDVIALWADVLRAVPNSRLLLKYLNRFANDALRERIVGLFARCGIGAERLVFDGELLPFGRRLEIYNRIDIALDPFPFTGCTTTFESLWMGVPVVTLAGRRWLGRMSTSFLGHAGLADWIAQDRPGYVARAAALASDLPRLAAWRAALRERVATSPLCDPVAYARSVEAAYRQMWRRWCAANP